MTIGASAARELITWAMMEVEQALDDEILDIYHASRFRDQILKLRALIGSFFDYKDQPVPFFYVHFLCLLTTFYLPLYSINSAYDLGTGSSSSWLKDVFTGMIVLLQALFVIGLRVLGQKLSDPFGSDLEDLSVMHYCTFTWKMSNRILSSQEPPKDQKAIIEAKMIASRESIGDAWSIHKQPPELDNCSDSISSFFSIDQDISETQEQHVHDRSIGSSFFRNWAQK
eukprot:CAMPEP_0172520300 /NCGR_PEP_ID=MMETSP1066-20121228/291923_1 /TAXON_ID=671091 /ORGANISM="Coscinodiscus wailesii, Strain CCMP2513" /LENGTH=226 /DNA_ID=CAMNT_0013303035 /DNA_START=294 /DNA_END=974 /DNA_ORIENTATION=+